MAHIVTDPTSDSSIVLALNRRSRPEDSKIHGSSGPVSRSPLCPFCPGQENLNEELYRMPIGSKEKEWNIRVINNKFPITNIHEVIIHSPDHMRDFDLLTVEQNLLIFQTLQNRFNLHSKESGKVVIFNNHGIHAGMSILHPHSQLVVVPLEINPKILSKQPINNVVQTGEFLTVFCPAFSQWPYEVWISINDLKAKRNFGQLTNEELKELVIMLQNILCLFMKKFVGVNAFHKHKEETIVPYNFYISPDEFYLRLIPRLIHPAGLEISTGINVNVVDPNVAAKEYKQGLEEFSRLTI